MPDPYKLNSDVKSFILDKKKRDPLLSCRLLVPLVWEHFQLKLSKSSINAIIKQNQLSSGIGRRRNRPGKVTRLAQIEQPMIKPADTVAIVKEIAAAPVEQPKSDLRPVQRNGQREINCGCFLLRAADYKAAFTASLVEKLASLLPNLNKEIVQFVFETMIYRHIFKDNNDLWYFLGGEMDLEPLNRDYKVFLEIDLSIIRTELINIGIPEDKCFNIKDLSKYSLEKLNMLVQELFFPPVYRSLDFSTMYARFFCLTGVAEDKKALLAIRLTYPRDFQWGYDIVWQEDFTTVVEEVNGAQVMTPEGERLWFENSMEFQK
jgi:hypothetical protein